MKDGKFEGQGKINFINGDEYNGEWKDNVFHGKGTMKYNDGTIFEGDCENKKFIKGKITFRDGTTYTGECQGDQDKVMREGKGFYITDKSEY